MFIYSIHYMYQTKKAKTVSFILEADLTLKKLNTFYILERYNHKTGKMYENRKMYILLMWGVF